MNNYFLFPFEKIEKNSRIIIYGAGKCGTDYYRQAIASGFCKVVCVFDRNFDGITALNPENMREISGSDYDYIIIAINNDKIAKQVSEYFVSLGVDINRIITDVKPEIMHSGFIRTEYSLLDFADDSTSFDKQIGFMSRFGGGWVKYFQKLIDDIEAQSQIPTVIADYFDSKAPNKSKIVMMYILLHASVYDESSCKKHLQLINEYKGNAEEKYWLILDLNLFSLWRPNSMYANFYLDRRQMLADICNEMGIDDTAIKSITRNTGNAKKICIVKEELHSKPIISSGSRVAINLANSLTLQDVEISIVVIDSQYCEDSSFIVHPIGYLPQSAFKAKQTRELLHEGINVYYSSVDKNLIERNQWAINIIADINPDAIIDLTDETSPLSYIYSKHIPTYYLTIRDNVSSSWFYKFMCFDRQQCEQANIKYRAVSNEQIAEVPVAYEYQPPKRLFNRKDYGLADSDFVLITVGVRLEQDLSNEFIDAACGLLINNSRFKWLIVGDKVPTFIENNYTDLINNQKIILWGYESDLPGLYGICDVYLNPDRIGGGTTIIWAMQQGLPVASTDNSGSATILVGDKLAINGGISELIEYVESLHFNHDKYIQAASQFKARSELFTSKQAAIEILFQVNNAISNWKCGEAN